MSRRNSREAILEAAQRLSGERAFDAVSTADVCRASGATNGSMFHFFPTKDVLHAALYLKALASYQDTICSRLERERTARGGIRGIVLGHIDWVVAQPGYARFLHEGRRRASTSLDDDIKVRNSQFLARVSSWLRPHIDAGVVRSLPLDVLVAVVSGPVHTIIRNWMRGSDVGRLHEVAPALADAAWAALKLPPRRASTKRAARPARHTQRTRGG